MSGRTRKVSHKRIGDSLGKVGLHVQSLALPSSSYSTLLYLIFNFLKVQHHFIFVIRACIYSRSREHSFLRAFSLLILTSATFWEVFSFNLCVPLKLSPKNKHLWSKLELGFSLLSALLSCCLLHFLLSYILV